MHYNSELTSSNTNYSSSLSFCDRKGDSIKIQDGVRTKKFCGSKLPLAYESLGNELIISFAVVLNRRRFSNNDLNDSKSDANHYIKDLTINKSINVYEARAASCRYCFRIKVSVLSPAQKITNQQSINSISSDANIIDWSDGENFDSFLLRTAGAATIFAGEGPNCY